MKEVEEGRKEGMKWRKEGRKRGKEVKEVGKLRKEECEGNVTERGNKGMVG